MDPSEWLFKLYQAWEGIRSDRSMLSWGGGRLEARALIREPECSIDIPLAKKDVDLLLEELLTD